MQEDIRKKVFLDVFVSKSTLLPIIAGGSIAMVSWAADLYPLAFLGFAGGLIGVGIFATKVIFGLDKITENAYNYLQESKKAELEDKLDKLEGDLYGEDADQLKILRQTYSRHKEQLERGDIVRNDELEEKLEKLFNCCTEQLQQATELYNTAQGVGKKAKKGVLDKREQVLTEIKESIQCFNTIIEGIVGINTEKSTKELSDLRNDVQSTFEVVKRSEERITELEQETRGNTNVQSNRSAS
jgi:hypothetical protein